MSSLATALPLLLAAGGAPRRPPWAATAARGPSGPTGEPPPARRRADLRCGGSRRSRCSLRRCARSRDVAAGAPARGAASLLGSPGDGRGSEPEPAAGRRAACADAGALRGRRGCLLPAPCSAGTREKVGRWSSFHPAASSRRACFGGAPGAGCRCRRLGPRPLALLGGRGRLDADHRGLLRGDRSDLRGARANEPLRRRLARGPRRGRHRTWSRSGRGSPLRLPRASARSPPRARWPAATAGVRADAGCGCAGRFVRDGGGATATMGMSVPDFFRAARRPAGRAARYGDRGRAHRRQRRRRRSGTTTPTPPSIAGRSSRPSGPSSDP